MALLEFLDPTSEVSIRDAVLDKIGSQLVERDFDITGNAS